MREPLKTKNMKKLIIIILIIAAGATALYFYYNRSNPSLANEQPAERATSYELFALYEQDEPAANDRFLNKVVEVKGKVREVRKESHGEVVLTLDGSDMFGIICRMDPSVEMEDTSLEGSEVSVKGLCTGMLMDVVMVRCVFSE